MKIVKIYTYIVVVILSGLVIYFFMNANTKLQSRESPQSTCTDTGKSIDDYLNKFSPIRTPQNAAIDINNLHFYILGTIECPHCRDALKFLSSQYSSSAVSFRDIATDTSAMKEYKRLYLATGITGIPAIGIAEGSRLFAVIEGFREITPEVAAKIAQVALKDSTIIVFADQVIGVPIHSGKADTLAAIFIKRRYAF